MYSSHSVLECYNLFPGVKLSIRSFCFVVRIKGTEHDSFENSDKG